MMESEQQPLPFLRNSERLAFKRCPSSWNWAWNMGLIPAMPGSNARWFGSCVHLVLAEHYTPPTKDGVQANGFTRGRPMLETWEDVMKNTFTTIATQKDFGEEQEKEWVDARELGIAMFTGYEAKWRGDPHWEVLAPEQRFNAKIPHNARQRYLMDTMGMPVAMFGSMSEKFITLLVGSLDLPVRNHLTGQVEIVDHKTSGRKVSVDYLSKDDQIGTYISTTAPYLRSLGLMSDSEEVTAVVFNFLKKSFPPDPETVDPEGRIRNKPTKRNYIAAIIGCSVEAIDTVMADDPAVTALTKLTLPKLQQRCLAMGLGKVWGDPSKNQGGPLFWREAIPRTRANRERQVVRIADEAEVMARMRSGDLPVYKSPGEHCNWCDFKDLCDVDENGDDTEDFINNVFKTQDPYADHRVGARNSKEGADAKKETGVW